MADPARLLLLGTGTSAGVPLIGCRCPVCVSTDPRNTRRRCALHLEAGGFHLQIDTPPDFRDQVLRFGVSRVDAVLMTHAHADHVFGLDDLRRFGEIQQAAIPVWADDATLSVLRQAFPYVRETPRQRDLDVSVPAILWRELPDGELDLGPFRVLPLPVPHGTERALGYLIRHGDRSAAYIPDCSDIPPDIADRLHGVDQLIINTLRHKPHPKHLHWEKAMDLLPRLGARSIHLTHLSHDFDHETTSAALPPGIRLAFDGLVLPF